MIKSSILFLLITIVFFGSVGICVFTHSCEEDGVFKTYFVQLNNHCEEEKKELPPCCKKKPDKKNKKDCCQDETQVFKLKIDYINFWDEHSFSNTILPEKQEFILETSNQPIAKTELTSNNSDPPPKLTGREILLKKRTLTI